MELKAIRKQKGLTQLEASRIAGVSFESYKNHELGRSKLDSPLGRLIRERITSYEPYDLDRGILPLDYIKDNLFNVFESKEIDFAYLFGSYAKQVANEHSDVDILISGNITGLDYFSLGGELERALHKRVDVLRLKDISSNEGLLAEIMATGVRIYDSNEKRPLPRRATSKRS